MTTRRCGGCDGPLVNSIELATGNCDVCRVAYTVQQERMKRERENCK